MNDDTTTLEACPAVKQAETLEISPENTPALFTPENCVTQIRHRARQLHKSAMENHMLRFGLGSYCWAAKKALAEQGHGNFQRWLARELPEIKYDAINFAMQFATRVFQELGVRRPEELEVAPEKFEAFKALVDGKTQDDLKPVPSNIDPATGKRIHYPATKTSVERIEENTKRCAGNWLAALETLEKVTTLGDFAHLDDAQAELAYGRLRDLAQALLDTVLLPRRRAKETALPGAKIRKP